MLPDRNWWVDIRHGLSLERILNNRLMLLDSLDQQILQILSADARMPYTEVARICNISGPAVHQRIARLERLDIIHKAQFELNVSKIGYKTCAFLGVVLNDLSFMEQVVEHMRQIPEIVECHYAIGKYAMFIKVYARDNKHLLHIILDKIAIIPGVLTTETFQVSLDEIFHRQLKPSED